MDSLYTFLETSLKEIRLLQLLPSTTTSDNIICNLSTVSLLSNPEYTALSYVWGNPTITTCITVNGIPFQATINLVAALQQIRQQDEPVILWIDALCINQNDNAEKSTQIQLMRDIYQGARAVTVWLGEDDLHTKKAIQIISFTASLSKSRMGQDKIVEAMKATVQEQHIEALAWFLQREWWSRIWIIQEVAVASRAMFLCGQQAMVFSHFRDAYVCWSGLFKRHEGTLQGLMKRLNGVIHLTSARVILWQHARNHLEESARGNPLDKQYSFEYMLEESWNFHSTNPRDKVYAWLGLVSPEDVILTPDYDASVSEVYVGLVKAMMEHSGSLSLVSFTGSAGRPTRLTPITGLPSWAPDLRKDTAPMFRWWLRPKSYRASSNLKANATISSDGQILVSDVLPVGRLIAIDADKHEHHDMAIGKKLYRWMEMALQNKVTHSGDIHDYCEAFFKTLICYHYDDHINFDPGYFEGLLRRTESVRLGFMSYLGYLDRLQDNVEWGIANEVTYHSETVVFNGIVMDTRGSGLGQRLRSTKLSDTRTRSQRSILLPQDHPPPQPMWTDFENMRRFFQLWDINDMNLKGRKSACVESLNTFIKSFDPGFEESNLNSLNDWPSFTSEKIQPVITQHILQFTTVFSQMSALKSLFVTDKGLFGLGSDKVSLQDRVCILRGCSLPLLIREHELGDGYEVLGQCYLSGCMYGECLDGMEEKGQKWKRFKFR
ncbi:heterokaryon incompatibility protein-domain-containing protein [Podospora fimiseda]|uniref:Heterokaryon incompatibility protein-domain-containing protein n=1 Tax=Podospora fimiseda TaxID=252190 RepID=A0AAN7BYQ7_9PEZI|nr:heterokaryon incompatibility protein-domain-containing protein [Podospora fimiseda]